jgi:hypothetical protein
MYMLPFQQTENGKQKLRWISLLRLPFAHRASRSLLFVLLFTKKQTEVIHLQMTKLAHLMISLFSVMICWFGTVVCAT